MKTINLFLNNKIIGTIEMIDEEFNICSVFKKGIKKNKTGKEITGVELSDVAEQPKTIKEEKQYSSESEQEEVVVEKEFCFAEKLEIMKNDDDRRMQIIALYWKFKGITFETKDQYQSGIRRELRAVNDIVDYSDDQIIATMKYLEKEATDYVWKISTIGKFISHQDIYKTDENLSERDYHEKYLAYDEETGQKYTYGNATEDEVSPEELKAYKEKLANHEKYLKENKNRTPKPINFEEFKSDFKKPTGKITKKEDLYLVPCPE